MLFEIEMPVERQSLLESQQGSSSKQSSGLRQLVLQSNTLLTPEFIDSVARHNIAPFVETATLTQVRRTDSTMHEVQRIFLEIDPDDDMLGSGSSFDDFDE